MTSARADRALPGAPDDAPAPAPPEAAVSPAKAPRKTAAKARSGQALSPPQRALQQLGLVRDIDLALHLPLRYEDETRLTPIAGLRDGETAQVEGTVQDSHVEQRSRRQLLVQLVDDAGDSLQLRFLHFYPSHRRSLAPGQRVRVRGEARSGFLGREMVHPVFRAVEADTPLARSMTPVYPTRAQLPQAYLRKAVAAALQRAPLDEWLPVGLLPPARPRVPGRDDGPGPDDDAAHGSPGHGNALPSLREALLFLHHPSPGTPLATLEDRSHPAWRRLKFEELLAQQLSQLQARRDRSRLAAPALRAATGGLPERLLAALPFTLTRAQRRAADEIAGDLVRAQPMHRLLQGDVGSGKTVVAALAAAVAIDAGWQCALMAPTEILAEQHFRKLVGWLEPLGVETAWLSGSRKGRERRGRLARIADGHAGLIVGTHAVIQDDVLFARLGLAIVDEQHRFGVAQRLALRRKLDDQRLEPHLLMMSATPIPRTLAMSHFADLDLSTLDELPPGRTPVVTRLFEDGRRDEVIQRIGEAVAAGRRVFWVCPLVEESDKTDAGGAGGESPQARALAELSNVIETHAELSAALPQARIGLLHGRLPAPEKAEVMARFAEGALQVLVATTVIEVGVDVPEASLMVIEHAERFGLSQLHQLRGRVGRGAVASVCVLLYSTPLSDTGKARLRAMAETNDGFEIARRDLEIRGPGEFLGARQSGDALLRFADLVADTELLDHARRAAPQLLDRQPEVARRQVERWLGHRAEFLKA